VLGFRLVLGQTEDNPRQHRIIDLRHIDRRRDDVALNRLACNCSPSFVQSFLDTVTAGSIHDGAWTEQPLSPFPAMT